MSPNAFAWICLSLIGLTAAFWFAGILAGMSQNAAREKPLNAFVSVLVAARNEDETIERCLSSLLAIDYPASLLEIILVDDHSTDQTRSIAKKISEKYEGKLKILQAPDNDENVAPKKIALDFGIKHSNGEFLFFTDADNEVPREWIFSMLKFYDEKTGAVAGLSLPHKDHSKLYRLERIFINYTSIAAIGWNSPASVCGQNFSYRRKAFEDAGGMNFKNVISGDDDLMAQAIAGKKWKVRFCLSPQSVVTDLRNPRFSDLMQSTPRHLSTAKFYPLHWQVIYGLSIIASFLFLILFITAFFNASFRFILLPALLLKLIPDGLGIFMLKNKFKFRFSISEFFLLEFLLPFYISLRPLLLFLPGYSWKKRIFGKTLIRDKKISVR